MNEAWLVIGIPIGLFVFGLFAVALADNRLDALQGENDG